MSSALPSPPATPPTPSTQPNLAAHLDDLLSSYLSLLDTYTTLRAHLSTHFSSGFLSLAHANRNAASVLGAGRRFGEDGYDERMKALRTVGIQRKGGQWQGEGERERDQSSRHTQRSSEGSESVSEEPVENAENTPPMLEPSVPPASTDTSNPMDPDLPPEFEHLTFTTASINASQDPLNWFTALPPPPFRQTQSHFTSAITSTIPALLTTISAMSALEAQIWDVRREMGIMDGYHEACASTGYEGKDEDGVEDEATLGDRSASSSELATVPKDDNDQALVSKAASFLPSPPRKQNLVSRTRATEPRSRVLKMD
jgi:coiled-coil domain-containing protein 115